MRKVVVVDDDREVRELLETYFAHIGGYTVSSVPNGLKLVRALRVFQPDVIVLDVMMSWVNGYDLCVGLKKNPELRDIPVIFLTARSSEADIKQGYACGAADYVTKPFDVEELRRKIERVCAPPMVGAGG
jgi:DNA-binding response OmpR family regulator